MKILDPGNETLDHQSKHEKDHQDQADVYSPKSLRVKNLILLYFIHILQIQKMTNFSYLQLMCFLFIDSQSVGSRTGLRKQELGSAAPITRIFVESH